MTVEQAKVIKALADNGLRAARVAKVLYKHRNTIVFHIDSIRRQTGLNPLDFYDMQKLLPMAQRVLVEYSTP